MTLDLLPVELLVLIFSFLEVPALVQCSMVCKRWRQITNMEHYWVDSCKKIPHLAQRQYLQEDIAREPLGAK